MNPECLLLESYLRSPELGVMCGRGQEAGQQQSAHRRFCLVRHRPWIFSETRKTGHAHFWPFGKKYIFHII